jgi:excisionase family DNA binding protein
MNPGSSGLLTLREAADRLGIHYMTAYRHVRLGMLPARKVGGSWRLDPADLAGATASTGGPVRPPATLARRRAPWADRLRARMVAGDTAGSWRVVESAMASGVAPDAVYVEIVGPALHRIGEAWQHGELGVDQEHLASGIASTIIGRLGPRFQRPGRRAGRVVIAMPAGERHGLGVAMVADIVSQAGYEVLNIGTDTPPSSLAAAVRAHDDVRAVIVSVVDVTRRDAAARSIAAVRRAAPGIPIVAGGFAVPDEATARALGADGWATDPRRLPALISELSDRSPARPAS